MSGVNQINGGRDGSSELAALSGEGAEVALDLEAMPEVLGLAEKGAEADGHGWGDGALAKDDFIDGARRNADGACHGVLGDAHGEEVLLKKDFAGCNWRFNGYNVWRHALRSMIIQDADIRRTIFRDPVQERIHVTHFEEAV